MERLTRGTILFGDAEKQLYYKRLREYEDTGLTPEEITLMKRGYQDIGCEESESETHNAIRKTEMVEALKWLLKHDGRVNQCHGCAYEDPEVQEECSHCMRAYSDCYFKP